MQVEDINKTIASNSLILLDFVRFSLNQTQIVKFVVFNKPWMKNNILQAGLHSN